MMHLRHGLESLTNLWQCSSPPYCSICWSKYALTFALSIFKMKVRHPRFIASPLQSLAATSRKLWLLHIISLKTVFFNVRAASVCYHFLNFPDRFCSQSAQFIFDKKTTLLHHSNKAIRRSLFQFFFSVDKCKYLWMHTLFEYEFYHFIQAEFLVEAAMLGAQDTWQVESSHRNDRSLKMNDCLKLRKCPCFLHISKQVFCLHVWLRILISPSIFTFMPCSERLTSNRQFTYPNLFYLSAGLSVLILTYQY